MKNSKGQNLFFAIIFFFSGISGLIYESIWTKYLKLFLGHAAYAQALVLIVFMGGMSLGAWLVGQRVERIRNPLRGYAIIEFLIGIFALGFDRFYHILTATMYDTWLPALSNSSTAYGLTWGLAGLLILPPAILLGATFPLMSNGISRLQPKQSGRVIANLYFVNSLGGAIGVLINSFVLVEALGLPGSLLTAGAVNVILACLVWLASSDYQAAPLVQASNHSKVEPVWMILILAGLTGCASFMYEIGWIRMLSMVLGSSTHSFELMLSAFITGLALGGWWVKHRIDKLHSSMRFLAIVQLLMGCAAISTLWAYSQTFEVIGWVFTTVQRNANGYQFFSLISHLLAFALMVPATFCAGMTLPLITHWLIKSGYGERAIGHIYSANTIGSILGVLLAVHIVMPLLGLKWVVLLGAIIDISLGIWILWFYKEQQSRIAKWSIAMASLVFAGFTVIHFELDPARLASGVFRSGVAKLASENRVVRIIDGKTATINLVDIPNGARLLATNGKVDASLFLDGSKVTADELTMALLGTLGFAHHDSPKTIAAIGMGSGMTSHFALSSDIPKRLDTIEIEPAVIELAKSGFGERVKHTFKDPRSNIIVEDARTYFAVGNKKYDLIISEPSNPWVSGVANLFTKEFYQHLSKHLNPDGVLVQWVQVYETDLSIVSTIIKALRTEFGDYAIYFANEGDIIIVATKQAKLKYNYSRLFESPQLKKELEQVLLSNEQDVKIRLLGDKTMLDAYLSAFKVPVNSDFFPYIDLNAARLRFGNGSASSLLNIITVDFSSRRYLHPQASDWDFSRVTPTNYFSPTQTAVQYKEFVDWYLKGHSSASIEVFQTMHYFLVAEKDCESQFNPVLKSFYSLGLVGLSIAESKQREQYWNKLAQVSCYKSSAELQLLLSLFKAAGSSDYKVMSETAQLLLKNEKWPKGTALWMLFPVKALIIAEHMQGHSDRVLHYWQTYVAGRSIDLNSVPDLQVLYMQAHQKMRLN